MPERKPLPQTSSSNDIVDPTTSNELSLLDKVSPKIEVFIVNVWSAVQAYWWVGLLILLLLGGIFILLLRLKKRQKQIQKLWLFTLFFLQKRQMLIPLVVSLSKKDGLIEAATQKQLLDIRDRCREVPFKRHPLKRLVLEREVSEILFSYFSGLAEKNGILPGTKFEKIVRDLEFIDAKLVQLQKSYNYETGRWNRLVSYPVLGAFLSLFGLKVQEPFDRT